MKKEALFVLLGIFVLAVSVVVLAKPNVPNSVVPAHAVQVSEGVFSLGTARDVDNRVVEGFMFIDNKKGFSHKPNHNPGGGKGGGKDKGGSTCFSLFAKGASWKTTEQYITDGVDVARTKTSLNTWDSEVSFNVFGTRDASGVVNGADNLAPDGKNEVMFEDLGATSTIAYTIVWGIFGGPPQGRELVEWDAVFNSDYAFGDADVSGNLVMDYQNIATHEFGHALGLGHPESTCTEETMYAFASFGETKKRDLNSGDITGINKLY